MKQSCHKLPVTESGDGCLGICYPSSSTFVQKSSTLRDAHAAFYGKENRRAQETL